MLNKEEQAFIDYWEKARVGQSKLAYKLIKGLPFSMFFIMPVLIAIILVNLFSPDWYSKLSNEFNQSIPVIIIALFIFVILFSVLRMHFKWESTEQLYQELKARNQKKENSTKQNPSV